MEYKVNIELMENNMYKEIEIDVYKRPVGSEDRNAFEYSHTFTLEDNATFFYLLFLIFVEHSQLDVQWTFLPF